jgi:hypothetical protein
MNEQCRCPIMRLGLVDQGKVLTLDHAVALEALTEARARVIAAVLLYERTQRPPDQQMPLSVPMIQRMN